MRNWYLAATCFARASSNFTSFKPRFPTSPLIRFHLKPDICITSTYFALFSSYYKPLINFYEFRNNSNGFLFNPMEGGNRNKCRSSSTFCSEKGRKPMTMGESLPWLRYEEEKEVEIKHENERNFPLEKKMGHCYSPRGSQSSWADLAGAVLDEEHNHMENEENGKSMVGRVQEKKNAPSSVERREEEELNDREDQRRRKFNNRFDGIASADQSPNRFGTPSWHEQDYWARKIREEGKESAVPKIMGEGVYGLGPVLAALSCKRREFFALYVQEGMDLSNSSKKKKDKRQLEKVLRMAENIGLSTREVSKHALNMIVDNRPHQGLVLDASSLEMVKIKELEPPISDEEEKSSVWVALDEVADPQNLGAIIRSAYFFGASGIVICAKNSAPLSGVVSKASAGSLEVIELRYCKNMMQFLSSSAENGWRVLGCSVSAKAVPVGEISRNKSTILVLGNEGTGLRPLVARTCSQLVRIQGNLRVNVPAPEFNAENLNEEFHSFVTVDSLNVSVAAGVFLHHLTGHHSCSI